MIFSLPNYRRLSEADLDRLRKDDNRTTACCVANTLFNILLLAALAGLPYYLGSVVLSRETGVINPRETIIGVWRPANRDGHDAIGRAVEFTRDRECRLWQGGIVELTAHYRFDVNSDVVIYDLNPPRVIDHREAADAQFRFTVTFTGDDTVALTGGWSEDGRGGWLGLTRALARISHLKHVK